MPPRETIHPGVRVTSTSLTGSQNDTGMPILGKGVVHLHKMLLGLLVSSSLEDTLRPPIVMGNKQDQQMSVIGFTNRPTQFAWTGIDNRVKNEITNTRPFNTLIFFKMLDLLFFFVGVILLLSLIFRQTSLIPEPRLPVRTPFGKLPFFDGVILYAAFIIICLFVIQSVMFIF